MGFDDGRIILDSNNGTYFAGQTILGRIEFDQGKGKNIHGIYVSFKGYCKVHWTSQRSRSVNDRRELYTVHHDSYEEYIHKKVYIFGNESGESHLNPGHHEYSFSFHIPANCPSTFEGSYGHIRYRLKAVMNTSGFLSSNKEKISAVMVVAPTDLNQNPYCQEPIEYELLQSYCCWCMNAGSSELQVRLPVGGYCPGQIIPIEVSCKNDSSVDIETISFTIQKDITYHAAYEPATESDEDTIAEIKKGPVPGRTTKNWTVEMEVPGMDVYNVDACKYIDISYNFKVATEVGGCHSGEEETRQIIFGTVPLLDSSGFEDNTPKQVQGVTSTYPPPPIINQPLPTSPFTNGNPPYPNVNTPYPNSSPYPNTNAPYPITPNISVVPPYPNSPGNQPITNVTPNPYPNTNPNLPYPVGNSPYPAGNSPHHSPYLPRTPIAAPYPSNAPQIISNTPNITPYPTENTTNVTSSNIPDRSPVPSGNSPVPPYPNNTQSSVQAYPNSIRTGKMGFIVQGDDHVTAPLLPPGANVPYPLSPMNPYANASAPEPGTPDSVDKPIPDVATSETQI